jgi:hypothetical protein
MIDETPRPAGVPQEKTTPLDEGAPDPGARRTRRRHPVAGGRIATAGIAIAAMLGLVANMEVADGRTSSANPAPSSALLSQRALKGAHQGAAAGPGKVAPAKASRPIVLTPHAVVHTVSAPATGGLGGSGFAAAPAATTAPVASTSGSH